MTRSDLPSEFHAVFDLLPKEDQELFLKKQKQLRESLLRAVISQIQARNNPHNIGKIMRARR